MFSPLVLPLLLACKAEPAPPPVLLPVEDREPAPPVPVQEPAVEQPLAAPEEAPAAKVLAADPPDEERALAYGARRPKSVVELQQWRRSSTVEVAGAGGPLLTATLVDLNPWVHEWFLVQLDRASGSQRVYHLENHDPAGVRVSLDPAFPEGLSLEVGGETVRCALWGEDSPALELARASGLHFAPLCGDRLSLRLPAVGTRSTKEAAVDFLRDKVWGGEQITNLVKETFYQDADLATSELLQGAAPVAGASRGPAPPAIDPAVQGKRIVPVNLGLPLLEAQDGTIEVGRWYEAEGSQGVYLSAVQPRFLDAAVGAGWGDRVHPLDEVESSALVYMTAFDLDRFDLAFDVGTDHPRAGWSERAPSAMRDGRLPGPDGFSTLDPLARIGRVNPAQVPRVVATFTGGFKRSHGAFRSGPFAQVNSGSHYGWVEHGVVESRPVPGLATWIAWIDGTVEVRAWTAEDEARLWAVRHLRQNGPPLLEPGPDGVVPGELVPRWSDGNWSGSVEGKLRSLRASLCVQEGEGGRFLLYGYFSSHTPSAMARVLAAYGCESAMLTDMNALEHTYLSLHHFHDGEYAVHHLITGMEVLDRTTKRGVYLPRFVGLSDNRDFFTVFTRRPPP
jgi:hypothetical protein